MLNICQVLSWTLKAQRCNKTYSLFPSSCVILLLLFACHLIHLFPLPWPFLGLGSNKIGPNGKNLRTILLAKNLPWTGPRLSWFDLNKPHQSCCNNKNSIIEFHILHIHLFSPTILQDVISPHVRKLRFRKLSHPRQIWKLELRLECRSTAGTSNPL